MRYPLIQGQGSLGTQESNDMFASSRYTEAKPSIYSDLMMLDYNKGIVPVKETYNNEFYEPVVLPSLFPNAICNGRQAIGISMAHNSAPCNLTETCNGIVAYINNKDISIDELMTYIPGPDFPLGNVIINKNDIREAFATGKSKVSLKIRGDYEIKDNKIIFNTIPYRTYRNRIKEQINKNIDVFDEFLEDFNDESGIGINKLVFTVKQGKNINQVLNKIFSLTDLQTTLSYNMNYIVNGTPKLCSLLDLIQAYYVHQTNVLIKATKYDKDKAEKRKHIIDGLLIALEDINTAILLIRNALDKKEAVSALIEHFDITEVQAKAILDMKLVRLTKLNKNELLNELKTLKATIAECIKIITDNDYRDKILIDKINAMKDKFGDSRRTKLMQLEQLEKEEENIEPQDVVITMSKTGLIKRIPVSNFKTQKRNGKGKKTEDNSILDTISTNTVDTLMLFSDKGKMYRLSVNDVPETTNAAKGSHINSLIELDSDENIVAINSLYKNSTATNVVFFTKKGYVKKTLLSEYKNIKRSGTIAIKLKEDDGIANVTFLNEEEVILITKNGNAIRFETSLINPIGRNTTGVKSIKLEDSDFVIAGLPIHKIDDRIAVVCKNGLGKKISINELPVQGRGGKGLSIIKGINSTIAGVAMVDDSDSILLIGQPNSICINAGEISEGSRTSNGNQLIKNSIIDRIVKL